MEYSQRRLSSDTQSTCRTGQKTNSTGNWNKLKAQRQVLWSENLYAMQSQEFERLSMTGNFRSGGNDDDLQRSQLEMPPPLPTWIWSILVTTLHIGPETSQSKKSVATLLHVLTLATAFTFGASGLFFNAFDTLSEFTQTTVLVCIAKSVLGLYWIGLGIYANTLATRLFSNRRMVECIRLHSKTIFKVNITVIVVLLSITVVGINLYSSKNLLETHVPSNGTRIADANCVSVGVNVFLCKVYFSSKIVYSCFCLLWNLLVMGIFLSVCRTHTISIRRFMKELLFDSKIYLEFYKIQALEKQIEYLQTLPEEQQKNQPPQPDFTSSSDTNIWDDDIIEINQEIDSPGDLPPNAQLLHSLRFLWFTTREQLENDIASTLHLEDIADRMHGIDEAPLSSFAEEAEYTDEEGANETAPVNIVDESIAMQPVTAEQQHKDDVVHHLGIPNKLPPEPVSPEKSSLGTNEDNKNKQKLDEGEGKTSDLSDMSAPIMTNEDLLFAYFQLLRRFSATSRLVQRWIANWVTFVMLWCALLIVYWTSHTAHLSGISQFLIPLITLGLLTSGYAEVNFEGDRLNKCVLPTEERMPVIYYYQNTKLELKIFSFTMTYNTIVTVVAGIAVTFATRIILDDVNLGKGSLF